MTREEAISILEQRQCCRECVTDCTCKECDDAFDMAIKALEVVAENATTELVGNSEELDCISRADAMTEMQMNARRYSLAKEFGGMGQVEWSDFLISIKDALNILRDLPSVQPKAEQEPCEDCISRKDIYLKLTNGAYSNETIEQFIDRLVKELEALPPVKPQEPKSQFVEKSNFDIRQYNADLQNAYDCGKASQEPKTEQKKNCNNCKYGYLSSVCKKPTNEICGSNFSQWVSYKAESEEI